MIPFFQPGPWHIGPLTIYPFGVMVGLAILFGTAVGQRRAEKAGLNPRVFSEAVIWMFVIAFISAHVVSVVFYFPERIKKDPLELLMLWRGISSFGGFFGAVATLVVFIRIRNLPMWPTLDSVAYGLSHGWIFGRAGCSLAHDHPGKPTNFFLGIKYPDVPPGFTARHDLGFYEMLFTIVLTAAMILTNRKKRFDGFNVALVCLAYAPVRFAFDFLRVGDKTYWGVTAGHAFSIVVFGLGLWILLTRRNAPDVEFPRYDPERGVGGLLAASETTDEDGDEPPENGGSSASNR